MTNGQGWDQGQYPPDGQQWQPQQYNPGAHQQRIGGGQNAPQGQPHPWGPGLPPFPGQQAPPAPQGWQPGYQPPQGPPGWQQPGYGQPYPGQPQYAPGPPPRHRRHIVRNLLAGFGGLVVVIIIAVVVANSGGHTISTTGTSGNSGTGTGTGTGGEAAKTQTATVGSAITLSGNDSGEQMSVTVTKVITDAQPGDEFSSAPAGDRLYAVQFRLRDTGSAAYSDSPSNGAAVVDSAGQSYQSALDNAAGCVPFPGSENIAPGASGLGCIVFEVPQSAKITEVQFTLDSGFASQTGQWNVG